MNHDHTKLFFIICIIFFILTGCGAKENEPTKGDDQAEFHNIAMNNNELNQQHSNEVKKVLSKRKEVKSIQAVNTEKEILISIDVKQMERFKLKQIRKEIKEQIKSMLPEMKDIIVSTDKKIMLELEKLENNINNKTMSIKEVDIKVNKIIKLSKAES